MLLMLASRDELMQFKCHQWNYFNFEGPRTNNHVEGWHSRLKKVVGKPHPNIYEIIDVFKREEASTKIKMQMLEAGAAGPKTKTGEAKGETNPELVCLIQF